MKARYSRHCFARERERERERERFIYLSSYLSGKIEGKEGHALGFGVANCLRFKPCEVTLFYGLNPAIPPYKF